MPRPFGNRGVFELSIKRLVPSVEAQRKITLAKTSCVSPVLVSTNRTPVEAAVKERLIDTRGKDTLADWAKKMTEIPLLFSPGTEWNYSISTDFCGYLVEVISGQRFDKFLQERIFKPMKMVDEEVPAV